MSLAAAFIVLAFQGYQPPFPASSLDAAIRPCQPRPVQSPSERAWALSTRPAFGGISKAMNLTTPTPTGCACRAGTRAAVRSRRLRRLNARRSPHPFEGGRFLRWPAVGFRRLAASRGWESLVVVGTSSPLVSRFLNFSWSAAARSTAAGERVEASPAAPWTPVPGGLLGARLWSRRWFYIRF